MGCKGKCSSIPNFKGRNVSYKDGQKRCTACEIYFSTEEIFCFCCHYKLRSKPQCGLNRKKRLATIPRI